MNKNMEGNHKCTNRRTDYDCPVCMANLHSSRDASLFMRCGHSMHSKCYNNYLRTNIACPLCRKSIIDPKLIEAHYDMEFASIVMPTEYRNMYMKIMCNDCLH
jgi:ribosomal protein S27E